MFKKFLALTLALFLAAPVFAAPRIPVKSIRLLGDLHEDGTLHNFCSTWTTTNGYGELVWISAAHCIVVGANNKPDMDVDYKIDGQPATLLKYDEKNDLAMFLGPNAKPLRLAYFDAPMGEKVYTFSYFWTQTGIYTEGVVGGKIDATTVAFSLPAGPGASGAPIMIKGDIVVGIVQFGPTPFPSPVMGGVGVPTLRAFIIGW